jgi:asparagine synthase (glutamine-hydrolysing)
LSGFVALFQRNGAPLDRPLLNALTSFLSFRGPDGSQTWSSGPIGLGHTLLRTTRPSRNERQPANFDEQYWIVADARLDRRAELVDALMGTGQQVPSNASDADLILHAYAAWKDDCLQRLRGDFSFAIWDARARRLFCARDHFGLKPFYYAETRDFFICSNTLNCVRLHPAVSGELDDDSVADFLLFGLNRNNATTTFQQIRRIPPAHCLALTADHSAVRRYWSAPVDGSIRYRRPQEYVEHFQEHLRAAVADRIDTDSAAILLSGGMDSGSVAAAAREVASGSTDLRAYTVTCEKTFPDHEGFFAKQTADFLGIPISFLPADHVQAFDGWSEFPPPQPIDDPLLMIPSLVFKEIAQHSHVALNAEGADNLMFFELQPYVRDLFRRAQWLTLAGAVGGYLWQKRARWHRLGARFRRRFGGSRNPQAVPPWIEPDFVRRTNMHERVQARWNASGSSSVSSSHPIRPKAYSFMQVSTLINLFETLDPGFTGQNVEVRFPFLDLRLVEYALALPPYPLFFQKKLERDSMRGKLPESILQRPKTPLPMSLVRVALQRSDKNWQHSLGSSGEIARYVDPAVLKSLDRLDFFRGRSCISALCLNFWLQSARPVRYKLTMEISNA